MVPDPVYDLRDHWAIAVYAILARHADRRDWTCIMAASEIAERAGISRATVFRTIKKLEREGCVEVERRSSSVGRAPAKYVLVACADIATPRPHSLSQRLSQGGDSLSQRQESLRERRDSLPDERLNREEKKKKNNVAAVPREKKPLPRNGPAQILVAAYCETAGLEQPANYAKAVGIAQKLVNLGVTPEDIPSLYAAANWGDGADLPKMFNVYERWHGRRQVAAKKKAALVF